MADDSLAPAIRERAAGALLGLAVGDALGTTLEFSTRDSRPHHTEMTGGGPFALKPGEWTDDTAMAIALAESLIACRGLDPADLMDRFVAWWRNGEYSCTGACFDIGNATRSALQRYRNDRNPFAGSTDESTAGNGSLMRLAPAALFGLRDAQLAITVAAEQSRTTHAAPQAVEACVFLAGLLRATILSGDRDGLFRPLEWRGHAALADIAGGDYRQKRRAEISSSGYVVATLEAALWSVATTTSFEEALILAVNLGDDADTVGAVTGQIAGSLYGAPDIPARWLDRLAWRDRIETLALALVEAATAHLAAPSAAAQA